METISGIRLTQPPSSPYRLLSTIIASAMIHAAFIALFSLQMAANGGKYEQTNSHDNSLQIQLNASKITEGPKVSVPEKSPQFAADASGSHDRVLPGVNLNAEPELITEIDTSIDDPYAYGFLILWLKISAEGKVEASKVIYSSLSERNSRLLEERFSTAVFSPKMANGQAEETEILLRIDVE